ncbi:MAG: D-lactate dehydrogenase [Pseudomonadota bacterium]
MTQQVPLIAELRSIVGMRHVITNPRSMERFCKGYRSGEGPALAVVQPGTLLEQWKVIKACAAADKIIIMQAANTGLTEGSTPNGTYDRDTVVLSTRRMEEIQVLADGKQIIGFPGATLFSLEKMLEPYGRQPHSVIGSSCIGASIVGGVCNNSGGSLIERGPSYTELALYARISEDGDVVLINHLGIELGSDPEEILTRLQAGAYTSADIKGTNAKASDTEYRQKVRAVDEDTPARFNADPNRLFEASGCAGKLVVFAVRLDTYPKNEAEQVFYLATNSPDALTKLRRTVLSEFKSLPVSGEYMHAGIYDLSKTHGKDSLFMIDKLGTDRLPTIFAIKGWLDARLNRLPILPKNLVDRMMQGVFSLWPNILPKRIEALRSKYEHHLILKMRDGGIDEARAYLAEHFSGEDGTYLKCSPREAKIAGLHRFVAAGAPLRYLAVNPGAAEDVLALDIALRRNDQEWFEVLPPELDDALSHKLYYGHFFCHVLHQDYIVRKGHDPVEIKKKLLELLDARGAIYPAEHNVGHLYKAADQQAAFFKECDPTNSLNPGIGKMSKRKHYA